MSSFLFTFRKR